MGLIWAAIIFVLGLVGTIIIAVAGRLLSDDVKEWLPWVTRHLVERAVSRLPENEREKRREEWKSDVNEWPGNLAKLYRAWGYLSAAKAIHSIAVSDATPQADCMRTTLDFGVAAFLLLIMSPLVCALAVCIILESPGPVLSRQKRLGARGRQFDLLKFRTMAVGKRTLFGQLTQSAENPRVTRVGRFIRLVSLDRLAQLFNVLRGDMSMVGPPPRRLSVNLDTGNPTQNSIKPGIAWVQEDDFDYNSLKPYFQILWRTCLRGVRLMIVGSKPPGPPSSG